MHHFFNIEEHSVGEIDIALNIFKKNLFPFPKVGKSSLYIRVSLKKKKVIITISGNNFFVVQGTHLARKHFDQIEHKQMEIQYDSDDNDNQNLEYYIDDPLDDMDVEYDDDDFLCK
ncbi:hypothetical protein CYY_006363 [Polysphondylium violaceum]|uniref:Uncharacterized protein n=1 Tax=Polysphondylium violaceum TaxID=133409 RepID=A0A8J4V610_9MYCE|nr:hypothetical protein CYY_006363 [Polysphondylium violaceum]